ILVLCLLLPINQTGLLPLVSPVQQADPAGDMVKRVKQSTPNEGTLLTREQVAARLQITTRTLDHWIDAQKIPVIRLTSGCIRFHPNDVKHLISKHTINASWEVSA
ncbi:helix-turn-helix domain-containing protein, partial [Verrucomicrobia bacterium]|nr:helix-turn-helix domain-containing protein [Verrucomicrobiota bacterium]